MTPSHDRGLQRDLYAVSSIGFLRYHAGPNRSRGEDPISRFPK